MEPLKALTLLAAAGVVSLVGAGAAGFYAGYSASRAGLEELKGQIANAPVQVVGGAVSLKPILEDIRALSKQVEGIAAVKASHPVSESEQDTKPLHDDIKALSKQVEALTALKASPASEGAPNSQPVLDEIKALSHQIEALRSPTSRAQAGSAPASAQVADYAEALRNMRDEVHALGAKLDKQEPTKAPKALADEIHALSAALQTRDPISRKVIGDEVRTALAASQNSDSKSPKALLEEIRSINASIQGQAAATQRAIGDQIRAAIEPLQNAEPKAPKALVDEIHALSASVQAQAPLSRRVISDEVRTAISNAEFKAPKALMDEIRLISANTKPQESRPQASVIDQIKILSANVEALKARIEENPVSNTGDSGLAAQVAELNRLVSAASDQFGRCQVQMASLASTSRRPQESAPATTTVAVSQTARREPSTVVFYDTVMLKKDQEKQYAEIGVKLALQSVAPRQVRLAVNRQGFGLAFGERKVFQSQDVECELNLMETNLNDSQARISISCKR